MGKSCPCDGEKYRFGDDFASLYVVIYYYSNDAKSSPNAFRRKAFLSGA